MVMVMSSTSGARTRRWLKASSVRRPEPVADARFRQDVLRTLRIGLDLLPQLPHINTQILRVGQIVPELAEQKLVRENLASVLHQNAQELVFYGRQLHFF